MATAHDSRQTRPPEKKPADQKSGEQIGGYTDKWYHPRFWDGMVASGWYRLLWRNRFHVTPRRWAMTVGICLFSFVNSALGAIQSIGWGRRLKETELTDDPIFVIGHWRSGTTLLHELLVLDPRHTYPNTFDCFAPSHFLVSAWFIRPLIQGLLPKNRPMDNMAAGWDCPQEDEFALCNMGLPSPYLTLAFANHPPQNQEYFTLDEVPPEAKARWKQGLLDFLKALTVRTPKRIVLKSPPHTCRVRALLEMFPRARFVHIIRNPYVILPSTVNLWKRLYRNEGLQMPRYEGLEEHVLATFEQMYKALERDRAIVPPGQLCDVRYEDLVADPIGQMRRVYEELGLGGFEAARPALEAYFANKADYKTNRYQITPELRAKVSSRWRFFFERYGYPVE